MNILSLIRKLSIEELTNTLKTDLNEFLRDSLQELLNSLLEGELLEFLEDASKKENNRRNGKYTRQINTSYGPLEVSIPRDRLSLFKTNILEPYKHSIGNLEDSILSYYRRGLSLNEISEQISENCNIELSKETVRKIVNSNLGTFEEFNLSKISNYYPFIYLDGTYVPLKRSYADKSEVDKECVMIVLGVSDTGKKDILGFFLTPNEGSTSWEDMLNTLKSRGLKEPKLFISDGLQGMPEAIHHVYPKSQLQTCLVHVTRNIAKNAKKTDRKEILDDFRKVYSPEVKTKEEAINQLEEFIKKWSKPYPKYMNNLLNKQHLFTYFDYPEELRKGIYTSNCIESFNAKLKRITRKKILFNSENNALIVITQCAIEYNKSSSKRTIRGLLDMTEDQRCSFGFSSLVK